MGVGPFSYDLSMFLFRFPPQRDCAGDTWMPGRVENGESLRRGSSKSCSLHRSAIRQSRHLGREGVHPGLHRLGIPRARRRGESVPGSRFGL